ncbi:hypothetical protein C8R47DRAFT_1303755 [Mycena vitilis]|nr:hypothetical protein C8R47DRAFT_1303755 [Mycena vitilis]
MFDSFAQSIKTTPLADGAWDAWENTTGTPCPNATSSSMAMQPTMFGALPYPIPNTPPIFLSYRFTPSPCPPSSTSTSGAKLRILDSTVTGPDSSAPYFCIKTDVPTPGFTVIFNAAREPMIIVEWLKHPIIEIRNRLSKRKTMAWLVLSPERSYRAMAVHGITYFWAPEGRFICLYSAGFGTPQIYARVSRENCGLTLELTADAVQNGIFEECIAAALLLQCGRRID